MIDVIKEDIVEEENNNSEPSKKQVVEGKDYVDNILGKNTCTPETLVYEEIKTSNFKRKLGRSLTEEIKPYTLWGIKDGEYFRLLVVSVYDAIVNAYEANVEEYAMSTVDFDKYQVIKDFISSETYTCEKIDEIENNLKIEKILSIGGKYLAYKEMTSEKITVIGFMLGKEEIEKIGAEKLALMSIEELNKIV